MKKYIRIILIYLALSITGFAGLFFFLYKYIDGLFKSSDNVVVTIFISSIYSLITLDLYLLVNFFIAVTGYSISRFNQLEEYTIAFKYLSLINLVIWILFSAYWIVG